ncbi:hypothetical protein [Antarctobacter jejuensis]|uniref:hypothetical protein n=1 Tax=Antarctobacter jejuensis TaxID=1439938 RepID=UPI003FD4B18D
MSTRGAGAILHHNRPDPDAAFAKALLLEAAEIQPMMDTGDGDRHGGFRTPCGTQWFVGKQMGQAGPCMGAKVNTG